MGFVLRVPGLGFPPVIFFGVLAVTSPRAVIGIFSPITVIGVFSHITVILWVEEATVFAELAMPGLGKETADWLLAISRWFIRSINYSLVRFGVVIRIHSRISVHMQISTGLAEATGATDKMRA